MVVIITSEYRFYASIFYIFAIGVLPVIPIFIKSYPVRNRLKSHMWGLVFAKVIAYILTAFVCEKFNNINILLLIMAGAAGVSLIGACLFKAYDEDMSETEKMQYYNGISKTYSKWQKERG